MLKYGLNTLILWVIGFIPQIVVALTLAVWFTDIRLKIRGKQFFKVVIYLPNLIMASAFAMLFFTMFSANGPVKLDFDVAGNHYRTDRFYGDGVWNQVTYRFYELSYVVW